MLVRLQTLTAMNKSCFAVINNTRCSHGPLDGKKPDSFQQFDAVCALNVDANDCQIQGKELLLYFIFLIKK